MFWKIKAQFDAVHNLKDYDGFCANLHGHKLEVEVIFGVKPEKIQKAKEVLKEKGYLVDFKDLDRVVNNVLPAHFYLNEVYKLKNATVERLGVILFKKISEELSKLTDLVELQMVYLKETANSGVVVDEGAFKWLKDLV